MADTVDITPSPRVLRMLGQIDFAPWQCLAELIDNSIDAFIDEGNLGQLLVAPRIKVSLPTDSELKDGTGVLTVEDNGRGMTMAQMKNAVKAGYSGNDPVEKMGLFGMGFNISTARLGRRTEVWTTSTEADSWIGIIIDFDDLERDGTFHAPIQVRAKDREELDQPTHGTRIEISRLEPTRTRSLIWGAGKAKTKRRLGKIYGRVMAKRDISISVDGDPIRAWRHCVWSQERKVPTRDFGEIPAQIQIDETLPTRRFCTTCWVWLADIDEACAACGSLENVIERNRSLKGWIGIQRYFDKTHFGIDLIRNGRVIEELDKSLFTYRDATGEELFEYPRDAIHWGGRIVGEIEIDFVRVSHQKDSFDKLDPEWKHVVHFVRGDSPIQPRIAQRMKLAQNTSPLARLFAGYRKGKAGLKDLVPGDAKGDGLNSGIVLEYRDKFYQGDPAFQEDEKWYELVLQAERANRGGSRGADEAAGKLPRPGTARDEEGEEEREGEDDEAPAEVIEKDRVLSRTYELEDLPGSPAISVKAFRHLERSTGRPFSVQPDGYQFRFDYFVRSPFFEESLDTPEDCLITDLAHHFLALSGESPRNAPVSYVARELRRKYFASSLTDVSAAAEAASSQLSELRRHYDEYLPETAPIDSDDIDKRQVDHIRARALAAESMTDAEVEAAIREGKFARYVDYSYLPVLVDKWPTIATDGEFFSTPYSGISEELREASLSPLTSALTDVRWLAEEGSGSVSKDSAWRLRYARALASLRLLESWRV